MNNRLDTLKREAEKLMAETLIIDPHTKVSRETMLKETVFLKDFLGVEYVKFMSDYINPHTPDKKKAAALMATRLSKTPKAICIATELYKDISNWVDTYSAKDIQVFIYLIDEDKFYTVGDYKELVKEVAATDINILRRKYWDKDRSNLEDMASHFSSITGWSFSGAISPRESTPDMLQDFQATLVKAYAGFKGQYGFEHTVREFNGTLIEETELPVDSVIKPGPEARYLKGQGVPIKELQDFRDYLYAVIQNGLEDLLKDLDMDYCPHCGRPVRTVGETEEDGYCMICDTPIPGYRAVIFESHGFDEELYDSITYTGNGKKRR